MQRKLRMFGASSLVFTLLLLACESETIEPDITDNADDMETVDPTDDESGDEDPLSIEEQRANSIQILTGTGKRTWRISKAFLSTSSGQVEITTNFNVEDDEFIFSELSLLWTRGYAIDNGAATAEEAIVDFYQKPIDTDILFVENSGSKLIGFDGDLQLSVISETLIEAIIEFNIGGPLIIELAPKSVEDYPVAPPSGLMFEPVVVLNVPGFMGDGAGDLAASFSENSLYFAHEDGTLPDDPERIIKYSVTDGTQTETTFEQSDFVTKRIQIIDDQILVFGAKYTNLYDRPLGTDPVESNFHDLRLSRFGFATQEDEAFVIGSDWTTLENSKITRYNRLTATFELLETLPVARFHAGSEIVNNKLYIFGGRNEIFSSTPESESFIFDLETNTLSTFSIPTAAFNTYAVRYEHLIYVFYETRAAAGSPDTANDDDRAINFWAYNTLDGSFTEVGHNLDDSDLFTTLYALTVLNDRLYVVLNDIPGGSLAQVFSAPLIP